MLRNPAYAGTAVFGKTMAVHEPSGLNRVARLQGRSTPRPVKTVDRPRGEWTEIPVPAIVDQGHLRAGAQRLADNKRFASRNTKVPSLLQGLAACWACGYGYYRHLPPATTNKTIYYYRCLGSRQLPLRRRPGLPQPAGPRRLPRHRRLGPHHRACSPIQP